MNQHLKQLIDLSYVDKEIDAFEPQIEEANYKLKAALAKKESIDTDISNLSGEIKDEELRKAKNELHLAELSQKLEANSKKSGDVKTEREMKSLQLEEEIAKEQVTFANEEIERFEKQIEQKEEELNEVKKEIEKIEAEIVILNEEISSKLETVEKQKKAIYEAKEKLIQDVNAEWNLNS